MAFSTSGATSGAEAGAATGNPWGAVAGGVIGGFLGGGGQDAAAQAAQAQLDYQKQWNSQVDPLSASGARSGYASSLDAMLKGGASTSFQDPNFQAMNKQSLDSVQREMGASGQAFGSNTILNLGQTAFSNANSFFNQQYDRLATLANAGGGGGSAPKGMDPSTAGNFANQKNQNYASAAGGILGGLSSIFGNKQAQDPNQLDYQVTM